MRIISKERDYYDGYQNHDKKDRFNKVYLRKRTEFFIKTEVIKELEANHVRLREMDWDASFMVIAGKVIPFVTQTIREMNSYWIKKRVAYFDADAAWEAYDREVPGKRRGYWWNKPTKQKFVKFFNATYPDLREVAVERMAPVFVIEPEQKYFITGNDLVRNAVMNVNLLAYGFTKYMGAAEMYQEIDRFVSNDLANDTMPASPQTDLEKVHSHGFDKKYGFRTRPKGR